MSKKVIQELTGLSKKEIKNLWILKYWFIRGCNYTSLICKLFYY